MMTRYRRHLAREDQKSQAEIKELQTRRWVQIARQAVQQVPFYRKAFQEHGYAPELIEDLSSLKLFPLITRETVKEYTPQFISQLSHRERLWKGHTSGSTGPALDLYMPPFQTVLERAYIHAQWRRIGYVPGRCPLLGIRARPEYLSDSANIVEFNSRDNTYSASVFQLNRDTIGALLEVIAERNIEFIHTYPSTAEYIASLVRDHPRYREQLTSVRAFLLSSETLRADTRELVERVFRKRVWAHYGQAEHLILGGACEHSDDYHLWPSYGLAELLTEDGQEH
jgi:phenylacetate-CoA ligase